MQSEALAFFLKRCGPGIITITGAGCSTESGIPDYRSPSGVYRRENFKPLTAARFLTSEREQRRYWMRSLLGFSTVNNARPNDTHWALKAMYQKGTVKHIVTQNVDGLHHVAHHGTQQQEQDAIAGPPYDSTLYTQSDAPLTELHGNIHLVQCVACQAVTPRRQLQAVMRETNKDLIEEYTQSARGDATKAGAPQPDGDFEVANQWSDRFTLTKCTCGGCLRPHVVLFGENVPAETVERTYAKVRNAPGLLCLGTSLQVYSAFRFVQAAKESGVPVLIANHGATRGDPFADIKLDTASVGTLLKDVASKL